MADTRLRTSFVPKKTLVQTGDQTVHASINLFLSGGLIVFFLTLAVSGGVYLYNIYLGKQIVEETAKLGQAQKAFEPALVLDVKKLDNRMLAARDILNKHMTVSPIFEMLQTNTLQSVRFASFKFDGSKSNTVVTMDGEAQSYTSVAAQADVFSSEPLVKNFTFSNLNLNGAHGVKFTVMLDIDSRTLLYKNKYQQAPEETLEEEII
jgi:hypothetical protein